MRNARRRGSLWLVVGALMGFAIPACASGGASAPTPTGILGPSPLPAPTETVPSSRGEGACANVYFPAVAGTTWEYSGTSALGPYSYTDTLGDLRADGFTLTADFGDLTREQAWSCTPEGLIALDYPGSAADAAVTTGSSSLVLNATGVSGVTLPSDLAPGMSWTQIYQLEGQQTLPDGTVVPVTGTATFDSNAVAIESVTVPAGTFEALRIERTVSLKALMELQGAALPLAFDGEEVVHFADGVGMIRSNGTASINGQSFEALLELTAYSLP